MQGTLRHDRHTVSMMTDHLVFCPKYRGKLLVGKVANECECTIRDVCDELDIIIIDLAINIDHVHLFIKYPPKLSVSYIAQQIKRKSSKRLREKFPELRSFCGAHLWAPSCYHGSVGQGLDVVERYISAQKGSHDDGRSFEQAP